MFSIIKPQIKTTMRKPLFIYYGLIVALFNIQLICSQNVGIGASTDNSSSPTKNEAHKKNYVEGEVLVRFKPNTKVPTSVNNSLRATDESDQVQQVFRQLRVTNIKPIYTNSPKAKTRNVSVVKPNTFKLSFDTSSISTSKAIEYLNKMDEVLIAEPNYIKKALGTPVSKISDPLFSQQWAIFATRVNELWEVPTITDKRPVIAILDTGLDIDHEEFSGKIWTNDAEINGLPGIDDDGNGYVDDSIGYSMIWDNSKIYDIGAHGTHCAGIAAAKSDNRGLTGMNPDAIIMPVQVLNDEGHGDNESIIEGLNYAVANGADVISLSLGSNEYSKLEHEAFEEASKHAIIVAAAGNDASSINTNGLISFPGSFPSVLGVESSDSTCNLSSFSNWDEDGFIYSDIIYNNQTFNYELRAPGSGIISTLPSGYGVFSGTSMATPCVAGIISRLLQCKVYSDHQTLKYDLINACKSGCIDAMKAYEGYDKNNLSVSLLTIKYTDENGVDLKNNFKYGTKVYAYPVVVNLGKNIKDIEIKFSNVERASINKESLAIDHIDAGDTIKVGPVIFEIPEQSSENYYSEDTITFDISTICQDESKSLHKSLLVNNFNTFTQDSIITNNHTTIIKGHVELDELLFIPQGDTLIIKPNTSLTLKESGELVCEGKLICKTDKDNYIDISCKDCEGFTFKDTIERVTFSHLAFRKNGFKGGHFKTCKIIPDFSNRCVANHGIFAQDCSFDFCAISCQAKHLFSNCRFANSSLTELVQTDTSKKAIQFLPNLGNMTSCNIYNNKLLDRSFSAAYYSDTLTTLTTDHPSYFGSDNDSIVRQSIIDAKHPTSPIGKGIVDISNKLNQPSPSAPPVLKHIYLNGTELENKATSPETLFPIMSPIKLVFSYPMDTDSFHIKDALNIKWESDTVMTANIFVGNGYTFGKFFDKNTFYNVDFDLYGLKTDNIQNDKLKAECLDSNEIKLSWDLLKETENYTAINIYGINFHNPKKDPLVYTLLDKISLDETEIVLNTKHDYYGYCLKLVNDYEEEKDIYNTVFVFCKYENHIDEEKCTDPEIGLKTALEIINQINEVNPIEKEKCSCYDFISDDTLNIQDFVKVYNTYQDKIESDISKGNAVYTIENNILYVNASSPITAIEAYFSADRKTDFEVLSGLNEMEHFIHKKGNGDYQLLAYSFNGNKVPTGKQPLLKLNNNAQLKSILVSDQNGDAFTLSYDDGEKPTNEDPANMHYFNIVGSEVSISTIKSHPGIYIQVKEQDGKIKDAIKFKTKK